MKELYRQANKKVTTGGRGDATRRSRIPALSPEVYDFASTSGSMAVLEGFHRDPTGICRARRRDWWFTDQTSAVMAVTWGTGGWKGDRVRPWLSRGVFSKSEAEVSASAKGRGDAKVLKSSFRQLSEPVMERELVSECRAGYEAAQVPQGRESSGWLLSYRRRPLSWPAHPAARPLSPANGLVPHLLLHHGQRCREHLRKDHSSHAHMAQQEDTQAAEMRRDNKRRDGDATT